MQTPTTNPVGDDMQQKIEQFAGQVLTDLAAAMAGVMTNLGHKLGLYRAMAESGPITSHELARRTATNVGSDPAIGIQANVGAVSRPRDAAAGRAHAHGRIPPSPHGRRSGATAGNQPMFWE